MLFESALLLQPTHTPEQKRTGAILHSVLNGLAALFFVAALTVIVHNKNLQKHGHFESPHAILGLTTYSLLALQVLVGFTQYYTPGLYGSVDNAKAMYKYHRISGYVIAVMLLVTIAVATQTPFNLNAIHIKLWQVVVAAGLILVGRFPYSCSRRDAELIIVCRHCSKNQETEARSRISYTRTSPYAISLLYFLALFCWCVWHYLRLPRVESASVELVREPLGQIYRLDSNLIEV